VHGTRGRGWALRRGAVAGGGSLETIGAVVNGQTAQAERKRSRKGVDGESKRKIGLPKKKETTMFPWKQRDG